MKNNNKKSALGMGLNELFGGESFNLDSVEKKIVEEASSNDIVEVNLDDLRGNPYQPRKVFDENKLNELAESIKEHGVFQPIIIKKSIKGYEIVAGERRARASKIAGKTTISAIVKDFTDEAMMQIALLENLQRENLSAIEEAIAYKNIISELGITQEELGRKLGKSRSHITNMIGILRLPHSTQDLVLDGKLTMGHARVLSKLEEVEEIEHLATKIIEEGISVNALEKLVKEITPSKKVKIKRTQNTEFKPVENFMREKLGTKVSINDKKITISFTNVQDLNRILEIINVDINK
ncbi:MAG: ParB/RepB/Spo0J family partition protein [Bacilli bacterium]